MIWLSKEEEKALKKGIELIMNPDGKETIVMGKESYIYENPRLKSLRGYVYEQVGISYLDGGYQFDNITRQEGYRLSETPSESLPTRVNESKIIEGMKEIQRVFGYMGVNVLIVKEKRKIYYKVAYLRLTKSPWGF